MSRPRRTPRHPERHGGVYFMKVCDENGLGDRMLGNDDDLDLALQCFVDTRYASGTLARDVDKVDPDQRFIVLQHGVDREAVRATMRLGGLPALYAFFWAEDDRIGPITEAL